MMIPRAFLHTPISREKDQFVVETVQWPSRSASREQSVPLSKSTTASPTPPPTTTTQHGSRPVRIPTPPSKPTTAVSPPEDNRSVPSRNNSLSHFSRRQTPQEILTATAIPIRRRPKGRPLQRLPRGDNVADFSRLLAQDVGGGRAGMGMGVSSSLGNNSNGNTQFDTLFGNIDELMEGGEGEREESGMMFVGSEGVDASVLMTSRSLSTESMPSLYSPTDDSTFSDLGGSPLSPRRISSDRRIRRVATDSEDCGTSHPLLDDIDDHPNFYTPPLSPPEPATLSLKSNRRPSNRMMTLSFKSSLSASLRALKAAAESISNNIATTNSLTPEDYAAFSIQPSLTDDKRPPPSSDIPSPALRRYLNPLPPNTPPESPMHLHFWHEDRQSIQPSPPTWPVVSKPTRKKAKATRSIGPSLPTTVPLQSCIPSLIRTLHASSPPIWLSPDGMPSNRNTAFHGLPHHLPDSDQQQNQSDPLHLYNQPRQREPRENRDFLRVLVAEMNMRRVGKLKPLPSAVQAKAAVGQGEGDGPMGSAAGSGSESESEGGLGLIMVGANGRCGKAVMWLPPLREDFGGKVGVERRRAEERWRGWTV